MGTYHPGIFGPFSGKVGSIMAVNHKGINVVKNLSRKTNKKPTEKQLQQTGIFGFTGSFVKQLSSIIEIGYGSDHMGLTAKNRAHQYHVKEAVTGVYPDYELIYPKVKLSVYNDLQPGVRSKAKAAAGQAVTLSWEHEVAGLTGTAGTDELFAVIYCPLLNKFVRLARGITRAELTITLYVYSSFVGQKVHCWTFFRSADGKYVSDTEYLGELTILA